MTKNKKIFLTEEQLSYIKGQQLLNEGFLKNMYKDCETFEDYFKMTMVLLSMGVGTVGSALVLMQNTFPEEYDTMKDKIIMSFKESAKDNDVNASKQFNFETERKRIHEKKVEEVCQQNNVPVNLFLLLCNVYTFDSYFPSQEEINQIDGAILVKYLKESHTYYLDKRLSHIGKHIEKIAVQPPSPAEWRLY